MPLILAIESDKRQASQLSAMARNRLKAELVLADSAERGIGALGDRVPDLILTPVLLSPRDEAALTEHLRRLDARAAHVQIHTVPLLAAPSHQGSPMRGMLSALRRDKSSPAISDGCDPAVFAEQVQSYLERAAIERQAREAEGEGLEGHGGRDAHAATVTHVEPPQPAAQTRQEGQQDGQELHGRQEDSDARSRSKRDPGAAQRASIEEMESMVAALEATVPTSTPVMELIAAVEHASEEPHILTHDSLTTEIDLDTLLDQPELAAFAGSALSSSPEAAIMAAVAAAGQLAEPDSTVPPVTELWAPPPASRPAPPAPKPPSPRPAPKGASKVPGTTQAPASAPVPSLRTTAQPPKRKIRRPKPLQDEWGLFDPAECGFAALVARLEEVAEKDSKKSA
jgi:hypothetical protein